MAPIRRYLRISKYSVLECRIYLDNPALASTWLLNPRNPVLPRVVESVRPLVLPKLREENERRKKKSSKKKAIKDVVVQDDFEVSIFLTDTSTRHSLLVKHKTFRDKLPAKIQPNSSKLISETDHALIDVEAHESAPALRVEEDEEDVSLANIPTADETQPQKRPREERDEFSDEEYEPVDVESDGEQPPTKRTKGLALGEGSAEDKKKLAMDITYEGFAIYGRVLCLVVKKRETGSNATRGGPRSSKDNVADGQAKMENWITSTQVPVGDDIS